MTPDGGPNDGAVGDFNGDGILDVAVSTSAPQDVFAYLGLPGGGYSEPFVYEADAWPVDVTTGDMNGDGLSDLVVGTGDSVVVLISQGDGGFNPPQVTQSNCHNVGPLAIADVNQDGWNDIVAHTGCGLMVFTNVGLGNGAVSSETLIGPLSGTQLAIINLHPNDPDIATVAGDLVIALNDGGESFATDDVTSLSGGGGGGVAVAPFSGGALPEIVAETSDSLTLVKVDPASGVGTVLSTSTIDTGGQRIAAADLNGDGYPDVVTFDGSALGISINLTDGGFAPGVDIPVPLSANTSGVQMIAAGDLNGDGAPDILVMIGNGPWVQYLNSCP